MKWYTLKISEKRSMSISEMIIVYFIYGWVSNAKLTFQVKVHKILLNRSQQLKECEFSRAAIELGKTIKIN